MDRDVSDEDVVDGEVVADSTTGKWKYVVLAVLALGVIGWLVYGYFLAEQEAPSNVEFVIEIDLVGALVEAANAASIDSVFAHAIHQTRVDTDSANVDVLTVFKNHLGKAGKSLFSYFGQNADGMQVTDEVVENRLRAKLDEALGNVSEVLQKRFVQYNAENVKIVREGARWLRIKMFSTKPREDLRYLIEGRALLEFKQVLNSSPTLASMFMIDKVLRGEPVTAEASLAGNKANATKDSVADPYAGLPRDEAERRLSGDHPFTSLISMVIEGSPEPLTLGALLLDRLPEDARCRLYVSGTHLAKISEILRRSDVKRVLPPDILVLLGARPILESAEDTDPKNQVFEVHVVSKATILTGDVVSDAFASMDPMSSRPMLIMDMHEAGAQAWSDITGKNIGKQIAIVLDSVVYSAPIVQDKIPNGRSQITGMQSAAEANLMAIVLKAGGMKALARIIDESQESPEHR